MEQVQSLFYQFQEAILARYHFEPFTFIVNMIIMGLSLVGIAIAYWLIISHRIREYLGGKRRTKIQNALNELFMETVMDAPAEGLGEQARPQILKFRNTYLGTKFGREVVMNELMQLHKNFTGITAKNIRELYISLNLDKASIKKLKWGRWNRKASAIRELSRFGIPDTVDMVAKHVNSRSEILRLEAQVGYLKLHQEHPFNFLDNLRGTMSEWHQLNLFNTVTQLERPKVPSFARWMDSINDSVVLFAIKMAAHFNQLEAADKLITLFDHSSERVRTESIKALGILQADTAVRDLLVFYEEASEYEKQLILTSLGRIEAEEAIRFISLKTADKNYDIALAAARALKNYSNGKELLIELKNTSTERSAAIIAHALDDRI